MYQKIIQWYCLGTFGENFKRTKRYQNVPKNYSKVLFGHFWHFWQKFKKKLKNLKMYQNITQRYCFGTFGENFKKN